MYQHNDALANAAFLPPRPEQDVAALTAIFAKLGVENVSSDLATLIRTIVIVCVLGVIVYATKQFENPVAPIDKLSVVPVAIFGTIFLGESLTALNWLGVLLVALGGILVALG